MKTETIITTNFGVLVTEVEKLVKAGYSVVAEGEQRPYHMIAGNFIVHLEKSEVESKPEVSVAVAPAQQGRRKAGAK